MAIRYRLLRPVAVLAILFVASCANTGSMGRNPDAGGKGDRLLVDLSAGTVTTREWSSSTRDCSDENYFCLLIPNRMVIAFPRRCTDYGRDDAPQTSAGKIVPVAPAPHLRPPSGSYIVTSFPYILLVYYPDSGVSEVREVKHSPYQDAFNPNELVTRYRIFRSNGRKLFACS